MVTLKVLDFEITSTLEDISEFAELLLRVKLPVLPSSIRKEDFFEDFRVGYLSIIKEHGERISKVGLPFHKVWSSGKL